jgi:hypothetical protein
MEAFALALNRPTANPVALADFKKRRRSIQPSGSAKFGNWRGIPEMVHQNRNNTKV